MHEKSNVVCIKINLEVIIRCWDSDDIFILTDTLGAMSGSIKKEKKKTDGDGHLCLVPLFRVSFCEIIPFVVPVANDVVYRSYRMIQ